MATHRKNQQYTPQQRRDYVEQFARSGLKQAEYCRRANLHPMTFSLWRRKLKPTVFAEVQVSSQGPVPAVEAPAQRGAAVLHLRDGAKLEVALAGETAWTGLGLLLKTHQA
jgi:transposase-like protein